MEENWIFLSDQKTTTVEMRKRRSVSTKEKGDIKKNMKKIREKKK